MSPEIAVISKRKRDTNLKVPIVETTFFPFSDQPTKRIAHAEALSRKDVVDNLGPNVIIETEADNHKWSMVAVLSPYTQGFHVMSVDLSKRYVPDPTHLQDREGNALMGVWANIVDFQKRLPNTRFIHAGWNCSPRSYGKAEEKGGLQSLTTKWHPQFWNSEEPKDFVSLNALNEGTRRAIEGNSFNRLFGEVVRDTSFQDPIVKSFLNIPSIRADERGVNVLLAEGLSETFRKPEFFPSFIKKIASNLDTLARDINEATTSLDISTLDSLMKNAFETSTNGIFPMLRQDALLLSYDERVKRILALKDKNCPQYFIDRLLRLNSRFKDKRDVPENLWFRKGFGYAIVFSEDKKTLEASMRIMPGIFVADRGGVVEALGVALKRAEQADGSQKDISEKRKLLKEFGTHIAVSSSI